MSCPPDLPVVLPPVAAGIPQALKESDRWAPWRAAWNVKRAKYDKVPHRADRPAYGISTSRPEQWAPFDLAWPAYEAGADFGGVGYCLTGPHGIIAIDLDNCIVDGVTAPWALEIIGDLASYTELSPSGRGYHIFGFGTIGRDWTNHDVGIEVYGGNESRFLTVTGMGVLTTSDALQALSPVVLDALEARYAKERVSATVIDLNMPDLLDELALPDVATLNLSDLATRFLTTGDHDGDRSGALHSAGVSLYRAGLTDAVVFSVLASNEHAMGVALDHRRQDHDRALLYLWREHCHKARGKGTSGVASPDEFSVIPREPGEAEPLKLKRDKAGILPIVQNVRLVVQDAAYCGMEIGYDQFRDEIMLARTPGDWEPFRDDHYVELRIELENRGFKPIRRELMRDVVNFVASRNPFDTAKVWLGKQTWDGVHRVDGFLVDRFGAEDTPYARAVSRYLWTALAGRVLEPGVKADMVLILIGLQGTVKSSGIEAMVPSPDFFTEISFNERDDDQARRMRGKLLGEIGELRGLHTRDLEGIKAFVTRTHERWVPKYKEFSTQYPRRLVFIGTTNKDEMLADETGNRRWLPLEVQRADIAGIKADREQLWAEAAVRFSIAGVEYQDAEHLAPAVHARHTVTEPWAEDIEAWLDAPDPLTGEIPRTREFLRVSEVAREALRLESKHIGKAQEMRIGNALRECGYVRAVKRIGTKTAKVWAPDVTTVTTHIAEVVTENGLKNQ